MMGGMGGPQMGAGAGGYDPQAFQNMLQTMMGGTAGAGGGMMPPFFGGGRCGGRGRWGGRRGMKGQRGPYNAEIVYSDTARKNRRHPTEVTLDDPFVSFTLKNTGEAAWPEGCRVVYIRHARIAPLEIELPVAQPGETVTVKLPLTVTELGAPDSDVVHHAVYRLKLPATLPPPRKFGDVLHVRVKLVSAEKAEEKEEADNKKAEEEVAAKTGAPSAPEEKKAAEAAPRRKVSALSPPVYAEDEANDESKDYEPPRGSETAEPAASVAAEKPAEAAAAAEEDKKPAAPLAEDKKASDNNKPAAGGLPADLEDGYAEKLKFLEEMGFTTSADLNLWVLREAKGNVQEAALKLVQLHAA